MKARVAGGIRFRAVAEGFPISRTLEDFMTQYGIALQVNGGTVTQITWLTEGSIGIEFDSEEHCTDWVKRHSG